MFFLILLLAHFQAAIVPILLGIKSIDKFKYKKSVSDYLRRDRYHCPITMINIVRTKGKAGYLV